MRTVIFLSLLMSLSRMALADCLDHVTWYRRQPGQYTDVETPKDLTENPLSFDKKKLIRFSTFDAQYGREINVEGYKFNDLAAQNQFSSKGDLALLHFSNGMIIPYPWLDPEVEKKLGLFVACHYFKGNPKGDVKNSAPLEFPNLARPDPVYRDPQSIAFGDAKVVVKSLYHPMHPQFEKSGFSAWRHMSQLTGIELVNKDAYYDQFKPNDTAFAPGLAVFINRCQFCHGVHKIGARFGWDFAGPLPIHVKRNVDSLLLHVKTPKTQAFQMGTLMPHQKDVAEKDVKDLWLWAKHMTEREKLNAYHVGP